MEHIGREEIFSIIAACVVLLPMLIRALQQRGAKSVLFDIALWLAIIAVPVIGYAFRSELSYAYQRVLAVLVPSTSWVNQSGEMVVARHGDGHFYLNAEVNNVTIKFMVDTGASDVALTKEDAKKLGIDITKLKFSRKYATANGYNYAAPLVLKNVKIGGRTFYNVEAHVGQGDLDISLFGMSAIDSFKSVKIDNDLLILSY